MRKWILILLFATNHVVFCQDSDTSKSNNTHGIRISFGPGAAPIWNYMKDKKDDFNLSTGLLTSINFDNWVELRTGLLVDVKKYSVYEYDLYYLYTPWEEKKNEKKYKFQYFRIPATFNFYFLRKAPLLLYSSFGVVFGIPIFSDTGTVIFRSVDYAGRNNFSVYGGIGMKYYFNKNYSFGIEPFVSRFSTPIVQEYRSISCMHCPTSYTRFTETVNSRNYFGAVISINYNLFIPSVKN